MTAQLDDAVLIDLLGQAYMKDGPMEQAEQCWKRALEADPSHCDPWLNLGRLALQRSQLPEAVRLLTRATELSPKSVDPLYNLCQAHRLLGNHAEAGRLEQRIAELRQSHNESQGTDAGSVGQGSGAVGPAERARN